MAIDLRNLHFHYAGQPGQTVLKIPHWSLAQGDQVLIHGPSGIGKSTLLGVLCGLLVPDDGQVTVLGQRLDELSSQQRDRFRAEQIGYVFQQFNLIPYLSAMDNLRLASRFSNNRHSPDKRDEQMVLLGDLGISSKDYHRAVGELSIGQQQRVAIARALVNKPRLFIADEPTSALDPDNKAAFMDLLLSIVNETGMTLLFVSHDVSLSAEFRQVVAFTDINQLVTT